LNNFLTDATEGIESSTVCVFNFHYYRTLSSRRVCNILCKPFLYDRRYLKTKVAYLHHISVTTETHLWLRFLFSISFLKRESCRYLFSCFGTYLITQFYSRIVSKIPIDNTVGVS